MSNIQLLVMDVDGTMTDGKIHIGEEGELYKSFNVKDGYGITNILPKLGIVPVIITGRISKILNNRCNELGISELYQGVNNKLVILNEVIDKYKCTSARSVAYIGDDMNDYECMKFVKMQGGIVACPKDAAPEIALISDVITEHQGGNGAVRDLIDWILCNGYNSAY